MDKLSLLIWFGIFCFCFYANAEHNPPVIPTNQTKYVREYCDIPDNKVRLRVNIRAINKFTGHVYGPQFSSFLDMN